MTARQMQMFGGNWTEQKLEILKKYLCAYTKALKNQPFKLAYIDAFAGTGYRELKEKPDSRKKFFSEPIEEESQRFLDGSARIALQIEPAFSRYIFIEKDKKRFDELKKLKDDYPKHTDSIQLYEGEANERLKELCESINWHEWRAVLFLDPFGMQIDWSTIKAIAETKAIDVWILFPLGVGVNRLLKRDGKIPDEWRLRLNEVFGTTDWEEHFYNEVKQNTFFWVIRRKRKVCNFESISQFYNDRLRLVFEDVAENPRRLCNSKGNPLFLFCFACGNPKGAPIAIGIAQHILKEI